MACGSHSKTGSNRRPDSKASKPPTRHALVVREAWRHTEVSSQAYAHTCDLAREAAHGAKTSGALGDTNRAACVEHVERVAELQQLAVCGDGQSSLAQALCFLRSHNRRILEAALQYLTATVSCGVRANKSGPGAPACSRSKLA